MSIGGESAARARGGRHAGAVGRGGRLGASHARRRQPTIHGDTARRGHIVLSQQYLEATAASGQAGRGAANTTVRAAPNMGNIITKTISFCVCVCFRVFSVRRLLSRCMVL